MVQILLLTLALFADRSSQWAGVRREFVREHPACYACGTTKAVQVHHVIPYSVDASRELDKRNLMTACRDDHLAYCHLGNWSRWNPFPRETCLIVNFLQRGKP